MSDTTGQPPQHGEDKEALIEQENQYNPLASPPDITIALKHLAARRVARTDMASKTSELEFCPCCGLSVKNEPLPVCGSRLDLAELGAGFPLYFEYVFFCGVLLGLLFAITGIWNLIANNRGILCDVYENFSAFPCRGGFIIEKSLANRSSLDDYKISAILNLVFVLVGLIVALYYRRVQSMTAEEVDRGSVTTSDYTVIVSGLPTSETEEKIKEFFEKKGRTGTDKTIVKKVNMAYEIGTFVSLVRKKQRCMETIAKGKETPKIKEELAQIEEKLKVFEDAVDNNTSTNFTGIAFITFNTEVEAQAVVNKFGMGAFEKLISKTFTKFMSCFGFQSDNTYNGKLINLNRAPEPLDVFWENLGQDWWKTMKIRTMTNISTFILIGMSFGMILGITYWQADVKQNTTSSSLITFLAFLGSYIITIINSLIGFFMRKLAGLEKHTTYTYYFISIATKLSYAQFFNTALITLIVPLVKGDKIYLWTSDSIVSKVFFLFLLNAFMPSLMSLFNPVYLLRLWKRSRMISQGSQSKLTQQEANLLFEGPSIDMPQRYANVQKTLLFTGFYASLLPIGVVFSFVGLIITYWTDKYLLLRRHARPNSLGKDLAEHMSDFLELFFVAFTAGNLIFEKIARDDISALNIAACVIACVMLVLPQKFMTKCIRKTDHGVYNTREYDEVRHHFLTEYDRSNPVTQEDAMKDWFMEMAKISGPQMKEEERKSLASYFEHMPKQNKLNNLANYAQYNPSFKQVQQMNAPNNFAFAPRVQVQQPAFGFAPVQVNQPRPMMVVAQPQYRPVVQVQPQPIRFGNPTMNQFVAQPFNQFMNNAQQMMSMPQRFMFQNQQAPRPVVVNHFPQPGQPMMMAQPKPPVATHFPQAQPQPQMNIAPKPQVVTHFPAPQTQIQPQQQPQVHMPQAQSQAQPQFYGQPQPQVVQVNPSQAQMNRPPSNIQMTQQFQPNQPFVSQQQPPAFGFQQPMQPQPQPQPQNQFGMRPPQMMQQTGPGMGQPMMQMNMGGPSYGMQMNQPQPVTYAPQMQGSTQMQGGTVFGGQPGFGYRPPR